MPPDFIGRLRCRLLELGCPVLPMRRLIREMADHHEDLKQAARAEGLTETEATARADSQLGDPLYLAEQKMILLRQSSWWGRHLVMGFCLVPLLTVPLLWLIFLLGNMAMGFVVGYGGNSKKLTAAAEDPAVFHHLAIGFRLADYLAMALVALMFCWLARRSAVQLVWLASACLICSLYALFLSAQIQPHAFILGIFWPPHWVRAAIPPLMVAATDGFRRWRILKERQKPAF